VRALEGAVVLELGLVLSVGVGDHLERVGVLGLAGSVDDLGGAGSTLRKDLDDLSALLCGAVASDASDSGGLAVGISGLGRLGSEACSYSI